MASLPDLVRLGRPHFLLAGLAFSAVGLALVHRAGVVVDPVDGALAVAAILATQWAVHYGNEAHDVAADAANATRTRLAGGTGLVVAGRVSAADARVLATLLAAVGAAAALGLAWRVPTTLVVSAPLVALAWAYSTPPLRLCARGVGELATGLVVGGLVPGLFLMAAGLSLQAWWPLAPLVLQVAAAVVALSLPDVAGDAAAGKRTLAVRVGARATRRILQLVWLACGLATTAAIAWGWPAASALAGGAAFAAAVALPVFVLRQSWDTLALVAIALPALQVGLTMAWALGA